MSKDKQTKRFEDFPTVDCNDCEAWWLNQCDGVSEAQNRPCTAFKPKRGVVIPREIKRLRGHIKWLSVAVALLALSEFIEVIEKLIGRFG